MDVRMVFNVLGERLVFACASEEEGEETAVIALREQAAKALGSCASDIPAPRPGNACQLEVGAVANVEPMRNTRLATAPHAGKKDATDQTHQLCAPWTVDQDVDAKTDTSATIMDNACSHATCLDAPFQVKRGTCCPLSCLSPSRLSISRALKSHLCNQMKNK